MSVSSLIFLLLVSGAVLALAGIDLVLPAIPLLPEQLGGNTVTGQWVIAAFVLGSALGFLLFGYLGARCNRHRVLVGSLLSYGALSLLCAQANDVYTLIGLRVCQGLAAAASAVFAPVVIRQLFDDVRATRAMGLLGSIESLAPGAAPLLGAWLLNFGDWRATFVPVGVVTLLLAAAVWLLGRPIAQFKNHPASAAGSYRLLLVSPVYLRYALSHAFLMGGFLLFVFSAPALIVHTMDGEMQQFILMQAVGVGFFICAANLTSLLVRRFGTETIIWHGTLLTALGAGFLLGYAVLGGTEPFWLVILFPLMNIGLGLRGPPGFLRAIAAGDGDDDRASSLTALLILAVASLATALFAPIVEKGLVALSFVCLAMQLAALAVLVLLPKLDQRG